MNEPSKIIVLVFVMLIYCFSSIYGQQGQFNFGHITVEDGLPSNFCWSVMKDSNGFIWITTRAGLCRYDGYSVEVYQFDAGDTTSLSDNRISSGRNMVEDNNGYIWIATRRGVNRLDPYTGKFKRYLLDTEDALSISSNWINCILKDQEGKIWIGTSGERGLNCYNEKDDNFTAYYPNPEGYDDGTNSILSLFVDKGGKIWAGGVNAIYQLNIDGKTLHKVYFHPDLLHLSDPLRIKVIYEDIDGIMFFGTQYGFLTLDESKEFIVPFPGLFDEKYNIRYLDIISDTCDPDYTNWVIMNFMLFQYNKYINTSNVISPDPTTKGGLKGVVLKSIYRDESGVLWIPGELGVNILNPSLQIIDRNEAFGQKYGSAHAFLKDTKGHFWIETSELIHFDESMNIIKRYPTPEFDAGEQAGNDIWALFEDSENNLWVGFDFTGLYLLDKNSDKLVPCNLLTSSPAFIYDIFEDSEGILWVGTDKGLYKRNKQDAPLTLFFQDSSLNILNKTVILCINEDHFGNLWIGTTAYGLFRQPPDLRGTSTFINYVQESGNKSSLSNNWVWSIYEDKFKNLWIATEFGLNKYSRESDNFQHYTNPNDRGSNFIYDLTGDNKGFLWMTTESGLIRFDPYQDDDIKRYNIRYKQFLSFEDIFPYSIYKSKQGRIYLSFGNIPGKGFYSFSPDSISENTTRPPIKLIDLKVLNKPYALDSNIISKKQISLNYYQNFISIEFAALDFAQPEKNQYAYYLEGLEDDWIYSGTNRTANYTGVPPGEYIFHAKGSNNDGYWNEKGTSITITILPPPWKTWWAYTLYGMAAVTLIYFWRRYDLKRQRLKKNLEIEQIEYNKLKELDSMKSNFFANISHEFRTPLTLILGPLEKMKAKVSDEVRQDVELMMRNGVRLRTMINQLLNLSKLESGKIKLNIQEEDIVSLINSYVQMFESLARQKKIDLVFSSNEDNIKIYVDKDKIEKILYNLLSNAFKYTPDEGKISVVIEKVNTREDEDHKLSITVRDTGQGIPEEHIPHIFNRFYQAGSSYAQDHQGTGIGLALVKELVELHHGEVNVKSVPDEYTSFQITIPFGLENTNEVKKDNGVMLIQEESGHELDLVPGLPSSSEQMNKGKIQDDRAVILVIDDNADLRLYLNKSLGETYQVIEACDGVDGLGKAVENIPDLIVTDVMMPVMDGIELCERIKSDIRTSHIPVILLTARAGSESRIEGLETGADDFITKPFDINELFVRIKNLINQRKKLRERFLINAKEFGMARLMDIPDSGINLSDKEFLRKAIGVIEEHLDDNDFSVEQFVKEMAVSNMQLYRKLKALVDLSANDFIRSIRLSHAAQMISQNKDNISQIAYAVGFNNPSYFADCFKKQFGVSPSKYQQGK